MRAEAELRTALEEARKDLLRFTDGTGIPDGAAQTVTCGPVKGKIAALEWALEDVRGEREWQMQSAAVPELRFPVRGKTCMSALLSALLAAGWRLVGPGRPVNDDKSSGG